MVRTFQLLLFTALALAFSAFFQLGVAESSRLAVVGALSETFTDRVRTSGVLLAGVHLSRMSELFNPKTLHLPLHPGLRGKAICLRLASRDGRYRGMARYIIMDDSAEFPLLDFQTRYSAELQRMSVADLAARTVRSEKCDDGADGPIVPIMFEAWSKRLPPTFLVALVNPGEARVTARLTHPDGHVISKAAACRRLTEGASIVFSHLCAVPLPENNPPGRALLELTIVELTEGRSKMTYDIEMPGF